MEQHLIIFFSISFNFFILSMSITIDVIYSLAHQSNKNLKTKSNENHRKVNVFLPNDSFLIFTQLIIEIFLRRIRHENSLFFLSFHLSIKTNLQPNHHISSFINDFINRSRFLQILMILPVFSPKILSHQWFSFISLSFNIQIKYQFKHLFHTSLYKLQTIQPNKKLNSIH